MEKSISLILGLLLSANAFAGDFTASRSVDLPLASAFHKLVDAEYVVVPTRTEMQRIPNCIPNAEAGEDCMREVVIESHGAIRANVSYQRSMNPDSEGHEVSWAMMKFKLTDFEPGEVELLKSAYPRWKHPTSNVYRKFSARNLGMRVQTVTRVMKVIDMANSRLCRILEDGSREPNCVDRIVYKNIKSKVKEVIVFVK